MSFLFDSWSVQWKIQDFLWSMTMMHIALSSPFTHYSHALRHLCKNEFSCLRILRECFFDGRKRKQWNAYGLSSKQRRKSATALFSTKEVMKKQSHSRKMRKHKVTHARCVSMRIALSSNSLQARKEITALSSNSEWFNPKPWQNMSNDWMGVWEV